MQPLFGSQILADVIALLVSLFRFLGFAVFGLGLGYLVVDLLRRSGWQLQIAVFLGLVGLALGLTVYGTGGVVTAFTLGAGVAVFLWAMPKKAKEETPEKKK
jgi:sulfite exporter TauE/SafE